MTAFGDSKQPFQGTFYKSNKEGTQSLWNDGIGPYFQPEMSVFSINKSAKIERKNKLMVTREFINRMVTDKPEHRITRIKFDVNVPEAVD